MNIWGVGLTGTAHHRLTDKYRTDLETGHFLFSLPRTATSIHSKPKPSRHSLRLHLHSPTLPPSGPSSPGPEAAARHSTFNKPTLPYTRAPPPGLQTATARPPPSGPLSPSPGAPPGPLPGRPAPLSRCAQPSPTGRRFCAP
jgi:hypothetical protein